MELPNELEKLLNEWTKDAFIDETEAGRAMLATPNLHAKYLRILTFHTLKVKEFDTVYNAKRHILEQWYRGNLNNPDDLKEHGLEPNRIVLEGQSKIAQAVDSHPWITKIILKKVVHEEMVEATKAILKELGNRVWEIRAFIDYEKFLGGR